MLLSPFQSSNMLDFNYSVSDVEKENPNLERVRKLLNQENLRQVLLEADKDIAPMMKCPREGCSFKCTVGTKKHCRIHTHTELVHDGNF